MITNILKDLLSILKEIKEIKQLNYNDKYKSEQIKNLQLEIERRDEIDRKDVAYRLKSIDILKKYLTPEQHWAYVCEITHKDGKQFQNK